MKGNFLFCKDLSGPTPFLDAQGVESIQWIHTLPCCNVCLCTKTPELASRRKLLCFKTKNKKPVCYHEVHKLKWISKRAQQHERGHQGPWSTSATALVHSGGQERKTTVFYGFESTHDVCTKIGYKHSNINKNTLDKKLPIPIYYFPPILDVR